MNENIKIIQIGNCMPTKNRANPNQGRIYDADGLAPTLSQSSGGGRVPMIIEALNAVVNIDGKEEIIRIKKLTPKECFRLMGFDDEDCDKAAELNSNTQLYKQAGNSIVVPVLEGIFKELVKAKIF